MPKISKYYNYGKLLSLNAVYNFAVGPRGNGKTYGAKKIAINDFLRNGAQFIYLRRYKEELQLAKDTFFVDIQNLWPDWDFRVVGKEAHCAPASTRGEKKREWAIMGYFVSLSTVQSYKSVSFKMVKTIIYDEFILEKSATHYLPNEPTIFNNFYSTVDRNTDKTRVFFLANAVVVTNPHFLEYGIETRHADAKGFLRLNDGFIAVHFIDDKGFQEDVYQTRFGKFVKNTEYGKYAVGNEFADNGDNLIGGKTSRAKYVFTLESKTGTFSVWYDNATNTYYSQAGRPGAEKIYTLVPERMDEDKTLMTFADKPLAMLRTAYRHGRMISDKPVTRNAFLEIFKR